MDNQWGSLIPIWGWNPFLVYAFGLAIDYGAVMLIRGFTEGKWYWTRFWSFKVGDVLGLPVYMAFASIVLKHSYHQDGFYTQWWCQIALLVTGYAVWTLIQFNSYRSGFYSKEVIFNPSELYHTVIYGVMFYLVSSSLTPLIFDHEPFSATVLALAGLFVWIGCVGIDMSPWQDQSPERGRPAIWEMKWWPWKKEGKVVRGWFS